MSTKNTNVPSAFKYALKSGLIVGITGVIFNAIGFFAEQEYKPYWGLVLLLFTGIAAFLFTRNYRNQKSGGYITFGKAFSICFQSVLYAGIIIVVCGFVIERGLFPAKFEHIQKLTQQLAEQKLMANKQLTDEQIEAALKMARSMNKVNPVLIILGGIASWAFMGAIIGLITAAICKKESGQIFENE
jgi:hypothetical protein